MVITIVPNANVPNRPSENTANDDDRDALTSNERHRRAAIAGNTSVTIFKCHHRMVMC